MNADGWIERADRALGRLARVVEAARPTPTNFERELERLRAAWARPGATASPEFEYAVPRGVAEAKEELRALRGIVPPGDPLGAVYASRVDELLLEADLADPEVSAHERAALATRRFGSEEGDATSRAWLTYAASAGSDGDSAPGSGSHRSDDPRDPDSLVSLMRSELGRVRAPARVVLTRGLAALAAFKDDVVFVAPDRMIDARSARRTVLHEVHGHVLPAVRARSASIGLHRFGSARGSDDQEGLALLLEERGGFLDDRRRSELAARHHACRAAHAGAAFVDAMRALVEAGVPLEIATRAAARAYRGARGGVGGLGRERVYVSGLERVRGALARHPELEATLVSGRLSIDAAVRVRDALTDRR